MTTSLVALGSGSRGNCFALECEGAVLLIDAGFSAKEITRRAERAGIDLGGLVGVALTHEHGDHASGALRLAAAARRAAAHLARHLAPAHRRRAPRAPATAPSAARSGWKWDRSPSGAAPIAHDAAEPLAVAVESLDGVKIGRGVRPRASHGGGAAAAARTHAP